MWTVWEELEGKFKNIQEKIEIKNRNINILYKNQIELLEKKFNTQSLLQKYSNGLNSQRQLLLDEISAKMRLEINEANQILLENKELNIAQDLRIKNLNFKCSGIKPSKFVLIIKSEFKFGKKFTLAQLIKYHHILGLKNYIKIDSDGSTEFLIEEALTLASINGHLETIRYLVENGADVNAKDCNKNTALILASKNNNLKIVKYLVENGADINAIGFYSSTALIEASKFSHLEIVKYQVENGVDLNAKDENKNTALILASFYGHLKIVKCLVRNGADVNAKGFNDNTAVLIASGQGFLEIVKYLIEFKADFKASNKQKESALTIASKKGHLEIEKYLLDIIKQH